MVEDEEEVVEDKSMDTKTGLDNLDPCHLNTTLLNKKPNKDPIRNRLTSSCRITASMLINNILRLSSTCNSVPTAQSRSTSLQAPDLV